MPAAHRRCTRALWPPQGRPPGLCCCQPMSSAQTPTCLFTGAAPQQHGPARDAQPCQAARQAATGSSRKELLYKHTALALWRQCGGVRCSNGECPTMLVTRGQQEVFEHQQAAGAFLQEAEVLGAWLLGRLHALQQPATRTCVETGSTPDTEAATASCFVPCINTSGRSIATVVFSWPNTRRLTTSPMSCLIPDHPEGL